MLPIPDCTCIHIKGKMSKRGQSGMTSLPWLLLSVVVPWQNPPTFKDKIWYALACPNWLCKLLDVVPQPWELKQNEWKSLPEGVKLKQNAKPQQQLATQKCQSLEWGQCTRHNWPKFCPLNLHKNIHSKLQLLSHKHTSKCFLHVQDYSRGQKLYFTTPLQVKGGGDRGFTDMCGYLNNMKENWNCQSRPSWWLWCKLTTSPFHQYHGPANHWQCSQHLAKELHPDQITPSSWNQANSQLELQERSTCRRG